MELPQILENAIGQLAQIPGVGVKTATRQVLHLSRWQPEKLQNFGESFKKLASLEVCTRCGIYSEQELCPICKSFRAENRTLCVVESFTDCLAIERSQTYRGTYHLLGGVLNPLLGIGPNELKMEKLFSRIQREEIATLILAINPSVEGDATCAYLRQQIGEEVSVERIGFGMPIGGHLEYLDAMTITEALENRKRL